MSLRYTGEATMDQPGLRDVERWKDKIEVRLDNRQVFFLFFGSAMVACMLFVLGVIVGKRLETRGRAEAPAIEDPLAVLDRFGVASAPAPAPVALTFPRALIGGGSSKTKAASTSTLATTAPVGMVSAPVGTVSAPAATVSVPVAPVSAPVSVAVAAPLAPVAKRSSAVPRPLPPAIPVVRARAVASAGPATVAAPAAAPVRAAVKETTQPAKLAVSGVPKAATVPTEKPKGRFLLQLSSFQGRSEADAFARRFAGQNAQVVATEIPGKGTWYRVRVGSYGSLQEATVAKSAFERDHNVIAYVAGGGPAK